MEEIKNLESDIRTLIIKIAMEQDKITLKLDGTTDYEKRYGLIIRRDRLSRLASECLINIDKEIEFFKNN